MTHEEKRVYLINWLLNESDEYRGMEERGFFYKKDA